MARMYPPSQPRKMAQMTYKAKQAEREVYFALKNYLPNIYQAIHHVSWDILRPTWGQAEGECDFVILHPDLGIFPVEVKSVSSTTELATERMQDAFYRQGAHFAQLFQTWITTATDSRAPHGVPVTPLVWTPNLDWSPSPDEDFAPFLLTKHDLLDPATAIRRIVKLADGEKRPQVMSQQQIDWLFYQFQKGLHPLLKDLIRANQLRYFAQLSTEQEDLIEQLLNTSEAEIRGAAGTGKTIIALQTAFRLRENGARVLLLVFNEAQARLTQYGLMTLPGQDRLPFAIFHLKAFAQHVLKQAELASDKVHTIDVVSAARQKNLVDIMREAYQQTSPKHKLSLRYDAILIDEAQDFSDEVMAWLSSTLWRQSDKSHFFVFYDLAQRLDIADPPHFPLSAQHRQITLQRNYRNTAPIYELMRSFNPTLPPQSDLPSGPRVEYYDPRAKYRDLEPNAAEAQALLDKLKELVEQQGVGINRITIITCRGRVRSYWLTGERTVGQYRIRPLHQRMELNDIRLATIRAFKGSESDVVIISEVDGLQNTVRMANLFFTAISRPRQHLIILGSERRINDLRNMLPQLVDQDPDDGELPPFFDADEILQADEQDDEIE